MKRRQFLEFVLVRAGLELVASPMRACFQEYPGPSPEDVAAADIVLIGTVTGSSNFLLGKADFTIQVEQYFKDMGPHAVLVTGYTNNGGNCLNRLAIGERWVFFIDGNPETDEILHASYNG